MAAPKCISPVTAHPIAKVVKEAIILHVKALARCLLGLILIFNVDFSL
jgi:hypothetical protein